MISVVIPLYNKRGLVSQTIATVLAQTYNGYEIVVVDDGSTDGSIDEVKAIADPRIRIVSRQNGGVAAARNTGIKHARGEFVAFLDADDRWSPQYLETQTALAQKYPSCDVFGTLYDTLSPRGDRMPSR